MDFWFCFFTAFLWTATWENLKFWNVQKVFSCAKPCVHDYWSVMMIYFHCQVNVPFLCSIYCLMLLKTVRFTRTAFLVQAGSSSHLRKESKKQVSKYHYFWLAFLVFYLPQKQSFALFERLFWLPVCFVNSMLLPQPLKRRKGCHIKGHQNPEILHNNIDCQVFRFQQKSFIISGKSKSV